MTRDQMIAHLALHGWEPLISYDAIDATRDRPVRSVRGPSTEIWESLPDGAWRVDDDDHWTDPDDILSDWGQFTDDELRIIWRKIQDVYVKWGRFEWAMREIDDDT